MSIKSKLVFGFVFLSALIAVVGWGGVRATGKLNEKIRTNHERV